MKQVLKQFIKVLSQPSPRAFLLSAAISRFGDWYYFVVLTALIYKFGGVSAAAWFSVLRQVPGLVLTPIAGYLADRIDRRQLMISSDVVNFLLMLILAAAVKHNQTAAALITLATLSSLASVVFRAARLSLAPDLVSSDTFPALMALDGNLALSFMIIAPLLGGLTTAWVSPESVFVINAFSFLISAALVASLSSGKKKNRESLHWFHEIQMGFTAIRKNPILLRLSALISVSHLLVGATWVFLPLVVERQLGLGSAAVPLLTSGLGLGSVLGMSIGAVYKKLWPLLFLPFVLAMIPYCSSALSFALILAALGLLANWPEPAVWARLRAATEPALYGRVFSVVDAFALLGLSLGASLCGFLLERDVQSGFLAFAFITGCLFIAAFSIGLKLRTKNVTI